MSISALPLRKTRGLLITLLCCAGSLLSAFAASPYAGFYSGYVYFSISGTITQPESPTGVAAFSVDDNGVITGNITGTVDGSGNITWDSNSTGFTTGTISGGVLASTTSQNNGGAISTTRIEAHNNAGGFGDGSGVGSSLSIHAPLPTGALMQGITYGGGKYVAVGAGGNVGVSSDGTNWISAHATSTSKLNAVAYGNGVYVAVGDAQTVVSSTDGITWTARSLGGSPNQNVNGVAFGNGVFVAVDLVNEIFTSTDGVSWTSVQGATVGPSWNNVKFVNGQFVAVGYNIYSGYGRIQTSSNGSTWNTEVSSSSTTGTGALNDVTYGNGKWVVVGASKVITFTQTDASDAASTSNSSLGDAIGFVNGTFVSDNHYFSTDGTTWTRWSYPNIDINDIITVNNLMVTVGGAITTTTDGKIWALQTKAFPGPTVNNYSSLNNPVSGDYYDEMQYSGYYGTRYTRVGLHGVIEEKAALNGAYTNAPSPTTENLRAAYGFSSSAALIVGDHGTILKYGYSAAVNKFTNVVSGTSANLRSITAASGSTFVAVGDSGTILYTSNYGASWTGASSGTTENLNRVVYFGSPLYSYIAVGDNGKILKSSNGTSWSPLTSGTTKRLVGIEKYSSTRLVAMADDSTVVVSDDSGSTWRSITINAPFRITYSGAYKAYGEGGLYMYSPDSTGTNWTYNLPSNGAVQGLAHGNGRTIALGSGYAVSTDLDNWNTYAMTYSHVGITFGRGTFVSVGSGDSSTGFGHIATSLDGTHWTYRDTPVTTDLYDAAYGNGKFVAVGPIGQLVSSADTVTWTKRTLSGSQNLNAVTYGGGVFAAVGDSGATYYSTDGDNWSAGSAPGGSLRDVAYGNGLFVAVGDSGIIRTSANGSSWSSRTSPTSVGFHAVSYVGNMFIAVGNQDGSGNGAIVVYSTDGISWTKDHAFAALALYSSCVGNGYYVAGGENGTILAAPYQDTTSPTITTQPSPTSQTVSAGATVSYTVASTGSGISYQWYKDGTPLSDGTGVSGATTATLTLTGVDVLDTGVYQVAIYNDNGSDLSQSLSLNVNGPPVIITHPVSVVTSNTFTTNFTVVAVGPGTLTYKWRKNGQNLADGGHYSGATTDKLTISSAAGADEGTYDVIVSNGYGDSDPSNPATLSVNRPPVITQQPVGVNINEGQTINLTVVADGSPTLTYVWKHDGVTVNDGGRISGATTPNLVISSAVVADHGGYTVTVTGPYSPTATSTSVYVSVFGPGALDPNFLFNGSGLGSTPGVYDIVATSDGQFVVGGDFNITSGFTWSRLVKIDSSGVPVSTFATTNSTRIANSTIQTVAEQSDGQLLVGGSFNQWGGSSSYGYAIRLSADGVLDTTYTPNPAMVVPKIIALANGKALIARTGLGAGAQSYLAQYTSTGSKDTANFTELFTSTAGQINSMVRQTDGKIWLGMLAGAKRVNADGTSPTVFGSSVGFVHVGPDDKIYYTDNSGHGLTRLTADGSADNSFSLTLDGQVLDMAFLDNGLIVIVGSFHTINTTTTSAYIAVIDNTGAVIGDFSSPYTWASGGALNTIQMLEDGSALVGGNLSLTLPTNQKYLQRVYIYKPDLYFVTHPVSQTVNRFDPVTFSVVADGTSTISYQWRTNGVNIAGATSSSYTINSAVEANQADYDVVITNDSGSRTSRAAHLTVLGNVFISTQPVSLVVTQTMNATFSVEATGAVPLTYQWRKNGVDISGATSSTYSIGGVKTSDADIYDVVVSNPLGNQTSAPVTLSVVGSSEISYTPGTLDTSFTPGSFNSSAIYGVTADAQGRVYVTGNFTTYNGQTRSRFVRLNPDLSLDTGFAPSFNNQTYPVEILPDGGFLVGGYQSSVDSTTTYGLTRFDSSGAIQTTPYLSTSANIYGGGSPNGIWVNNDGSYVIGGSFFSVNGTTVRYVAKVKADHTLDTSFIPTAYPSGSAKAVAQAPDGSILVSGYFTTTVGGDTHYGIARYNSNGSLDTSFQTYVDTSSTYSPYCINFQSDGKIIIAGPFSSVRDNPGAGSQTRYGIARLNTDGTVDTAFDAKLNAGSAVYDLIVQPDDKIIIVGTFSTVNGTARGKIARLNADGSLDTTFATGSGANSYIYSIAQLPSGGYIVGGLFTSFDGNNSKQYLAKIYGEPPVPPARNIIKQPVSQSVLAGNSVDFTVAAVGKAPLTFQWMHGTDPVPDANNPSLHISNASAGDAGNYTVVVTDADGNTTSDVATLTLTTGHTFAEWVADKGLTTGVNDALTDDPDGDGFNNAFEYVFGSHPNQTNDRPTFTYITVNVDGVDYQAIQVIALKDVTDLDVMVNASTDVSFTSLVGTFNSSEDLGNGTQKYTIRANVPKSSAPHVFFRIVVSGVSVEI